MFRCGQITHFALQALVVSIRTVLGNRLNARLNALPMKEQDILDRFVLFCPVLLITFSSLSDLGLVNKLSSIFGWLRPCLPAGKFGWRCQQNSDYQPVGLRFASLPVLSSLEPKTKPNFFTSPYTCWRFISEYVFSSQYSHIAPDSRKAGPPIPDRQWKYYSNL